LREVIKQKANKQPVQMGSADKLVLLNGSSAFVEHTKSGGNNF